VIGAVPDQGDIRSQRGEEQERHTPAKYLVAPEGEGAHPVARMQQPVSEAECLETTGADTHFAHHLSASARRGGLGGASRRIEADFITLLQDPHAEHEIFNDGGGRQRSVELVPEGIDAAVAADEKAETALASLDPPFVLPVQPFSRNATFLFQSELTAHATDTAIAEVFYQPAKGVGCEHRVRVRHDHDLRIRLPDQIVQYRNLAATFRV